MRRIPLAIAALTIVMVCRPSPAIAQNWVATDIGALAGATSSWASAVNDLGWVTGS